MAVVLLVEDNRDNRDIYCTILQYAGHSVVEAANGVEGIARASECSPDVIVMDVTMPVMDGLEATRRLRATAQTASTPILILTAHAHSTDLAEAMEAGASAYLAKPCPPMVVMEEVARLLRDAL